MHGHASICLWPIKGRRDYRFSQLSIVHWKFANWARKKISNQWAIFQWTIYNFRTLRPGRIATLEKPGCHTARLILTDCTRSHSVTCRARLFSYVLASERIISSGGIFLLCEVGSAEGRSGLEDKFLSDSCVKKLRSTIAGASVLFTKADGQTATWPF